MPYVKKTAELTERMGGRYIMRTGGADLLEGKFGDGGGVLIVEWPDKQTALKFWNCAEYAKLKKLRADLTDVQALLIEGQMVL